jgi:hypothetical protein
MDERSWVTKHELDKAAEERDIDFLCLQIWNPNLSPEKREHLAQLIHSLLLGKMPRPKGRPRASAASKNTGSIAIRVLSLKREGWKLSAAVREAATAFKCKDRKVYECLRTFRQTLREVEASYEYRQIWGWQDDLEERRREEERAEEERLEEQRHEEELHEEALREEMLEEERRLEALTAKKSHT